MVSLLRAAGIYNDWLLVEFVLIKLPLRYIYEISIIVLSEISIFTVFPVIKLQESQWVTQTRALAAVETWQVYLHISSHFWLR